MLIVKIFGTLDLLAGVILLFNIHNPLTNIFVFYCIMKGIWSIISSIAASYYFDWMGLTDLLNGICLLLVRFNIFFPNLFKIVGVIMIIKGLYIILSGFLASH